MVRLVLRRRPVLNWRLRTANLSAVSSFRHVVDGEEIIMRPRYIRLATVMVAVLLFATAPARAQFATAVATTGQIAPGTAGNSFVGFGAAAINGNGQVAFLGTMSGLTGAGDPNQGLFVTEIPVQIGAQTLPSGLTGSVGQNTLTPVGPFVSQASSGANPTFYTALSGGPAPINGATTTQNNLAFFSTFDPTVCLSTPLSTSSTNPLLTSGFVSFRAAMNTSSIFGVFGTEAPPTAATATLPSQPWIMHQAAATTALFPPDTTNTIQWSSVADPAQNNKGLIAFQATLSNNQGGIFTALATQQTTTPPAPPTVMTITPIALSGNAAPNAPPPAGAATNSGIFQSFDPRIAISDAGAIAFLSNVSGGGGQLICFVSPTGTVSGVALTTSNSTNPPTDGTDAPAVPNGPPQNPPAKFTTLSVNPGYSPVSLSDFNGGQVVFKANLSTGPGPGDSGIYAWSNNTLQGIAVTRQDLSQVPGGPLGLNTGNNANTYSVLYPDGKYHTGPANQQPVHFLEFTSDIAQNNGTRTGIINNQGQVAFAASLAPGGSGGVFIFRPTTGFTPISINPVAMSGNPAPGAGTGVFYASFGSSIGLNAHAGRIGATAPTGSPEIAFIANLYGTGVTTTNDQGIFLANDQVLPNTSLALAPNNAHITETALLVRTGDFLQVTPGVSMQVKVITPFYTSSGNGRTSLNDLGQVTATITFADDRTQGVYTFAPDLRVSQFAFNAGGPAAITADWQVPANWTFAYSPTAQIYRIAADPTDIPGVTTLTVNNVPSQTVPGLKVGGATGVTHFLTGASNLTVGVSGTTDGSTVLTIQQPSDITGTGTLTLKGDVRALAGFTGAGAAGTTATISTNVDLGNVPLTSIPVSPILPPPPSTADVDRFRTFNVDRGNFVGANPVDLLISGVLGSATETGTAPDGTIFNNPIHRGIIKTGGGVLKLTGTNTFGPDVTQVVQSVQPPARANNNVTDTYLQGAFIQSVQVLGGTLSIDRDANLGLSPGAPGPGNPYRGRWITLNGGSTSKLSVDPTGQLTTTDGTLQFTGSFTLDPNRGIALGPVSGAGFGIMQVTAGNAVTYAGVISDNFDGITQGVGTLVVEGPGTLTLTGVNTYRGGTIVKPGTLIVASDASLGAAGTSVQILANDTLIYNGNSATTRPFTLTGGTLAVATGKTLTLNNTTITGGTINGPGAFATMGNGAATTFLNGAVGQSGKVTLVGADVMTGYSNSGQITVAQVNAAAGATPVTLSQFVNQGSGSITVQPPSTAQTTSTLNLSDFQSSGLLIVNPATVTANFSQTTLLKNTGFSTLAFNAGSRTFVGTPQTAVFPVGDPQAGLPTFVAGIDLNGKNAIVTGGLFVNNGYVEDTTNGGAGTATVVADFGSLVKGAGFYQNGVITQNGGRFQAGNSPGLANFGKLVIGPGGVNNYVMAINDATGTAGPTPDATGHVSGWGLSKALSTTLGTQTTSGDFTWSATPADKLTFAIDTLVNPTTVGNDIAGPMADFDPTRTYSWQAFQWSGAYAGPADDATLVASTVFDTSGFKNQLGGAFGWDLDAGGHSLSLVYTPSAVPEPGTLALVGLAAAIGWRQRRRIGRP
jgi:autotransporter-associated beta strand protein